MLEQLMYKTPTYKSMKVRKSHNRIMYVITTQQSNHPTWLGRLCGKGYYEDIAEFIGRDKVWREFPSFAQIPIKLRFQLFADWTALRHKCEE